MARFIFLLSIHSYLKIEESSQKKNHFNDWTLLPLFTLKHK